MQVDVIDTSEDAVYEAMSIAQPENGIDTGKPNDNTDIRGAKAREQADSFKNMLSRRMKRKDRDRDEL